MALPDPRVFIAFQRFGFGPRPGDLASVSDARAALRAEIAQADAGLITSEEVKAFGLGGTAANTKVMFDAAEARKASQATATALRGPSEPAGRSEAGIEAAIGRVAALKEVTDAEGRLLRNEALVRFRRACTAPVGFVERLVTFWSNHFCVSLAKGELERAIAGSFEREAIRPYVLGRFGDMLAAVERHPAMLTYLDNAQSVGPEAPGNRQGRRGLNENLAREILELHTLGVAGGYNQDDVTSFARVLTGWTVAGHDGRLGDPGSFVFNANLHEPGTASIAGASYGPGGFGQGEAVLADLARHPATAKHLATKLARHFIADDPPPSIVDRIASVFTRTDGNLRAVSLALADLPEAWSLPLTKIRSPYDFLIATNRLLDRVVTEPWSIIGALKLLGMPLWEPPGPNGFADVAGAWASAEGLKLRLDLSAQVAHGVGGDRTADMILADAFGDAASEDTKAIVSRAESREQAIALILMAPEFQRR